jgi:Holliday junction DNA helicase RuvA
MIALLRGRLAGVLDDALIVDVGGVGYLVHCAPQTAATLRGQGEAVEVHVETQVREDSITLYGFADPAERLWFRLLQGIQGVGARTAIAVLGVLPPPTLVKAVAAQDRVALTRVPGVGPKLAARILSELKDRVGALPTPTRRATGATALPATGDAVGDAVAALVNLGYGRADAFAAVARCQARLGETAPIAALIREGLRELAG